MKDMKNDEFQDIGLLKKYFYPRLFKTLFNFKMKFKIKDDQSLEKLERILGAWIDKYKLNIDGDLSNIKYRVLDQLDMDIYNKFLDLKALMDDYSPVKADKLAIIEVEKQLKNFLKIFTESFESEIDENFQELFSTLDREISKWSKEL